MSKLDIDYLKDIAHNTSRHHDFSNLLTFDTNHFTQNIYPPIQLDEDWQVGLMNFSVYNNIQNITAKIMYLNIQLTMVQLGPQLHLHQVVMKLTQLIPKLID